MKQFQQIYLAGLFLFQLQIPAKAQTLNLDLNFGNNGVWNTTEKLSTQLNILPDESIILSGYRPSTGEKSDGLLTKLQNTGITDTLFGSFGFAQISFDDLFSGYYPYESFSISTCFEDGRILAVGRKGSLFLDNPVKMILAVLHPNGQLDSSFGTSGRRILEIEGYSAGQPGLFRYSNGDVLLYSVLNVAGTIEKNHLFLLRLQPDGNPDLSFGPNGDGTALYFVGPDSPLIGGIGTPQFLLTPEDQLLVGGATDNGTFTMFRYKADGLADENFGTNGKAVLETGFGTLIYGLNLQSDRKIVIFGSIRVAGDPNCAIVRLNTDGSLDNSWADQGIMIHDIGYYENSIEQGIVQADGKILVFADRLQENGVRETVWVRYLQNGMPDPGFGVDGFQLFALENEYIFSRELKITPDHAVWLAGTRSNLGIGTTFIAKFIPDNYVRTASPVSKSDFEGLLFPNIATPGQVLTLRYSLSKTSCWSAQLMDAQGIIVQNFGVLDGRSAGTHNLELRLRDDLPLGLYHLTLQSQGTQTSLPVFLKR